MKYQSIDFQIQNLKAYDALLIGGRENRNEIVLLDIENKEVILIAYLNSFEKLMGYSLNPDDFNSFYALVDNTEVLLLPQEAYMEEMLPLYKSYLNSDGLVDSEVTSLDILEINAIESFDFSAFSLEITSLENFQYKSLTHVLLEGMATYLMEDENHTLGFHFSQDKVYVYYFNYGKLEFFNIYHASKIEGFKTQILNNIEKVLKTEKDSCRCFVSGDLNTLNQYEDLIKNEFRFMERVDVTEITGDGIVPEEIMSQQVEYLPVYLYMHHLNL